MKVTRRGMLAGAAIGGGLLVAWSLMPREYEAPLAPGRGEAVFDAWLRIARDGVITVGVPQLEMGQGVTTILPQIVATELGADWRQMAVEPVPASGAFANLPLAARWSPLWRPPVPALADQPDDILLRRWAQSTRFVVTADGSTLPAYGQACCEAGASARAMLQMAAARRWDVPWLECATRDGFVTHQGLGERRRATFGELAIEAARFEPPDPPLLRPKDGADPPATSRGDGPPAGAAGQARTAFPRLDLPAKVDGSYLFAGDVRLPNLLHAAIRHGPRPMAELASYDIAAAEGQRGLVGVIRGKRFLAAAAETWWAAEQALEKMSPRFNVTGMVRSDEMARQLDEAVRGGDYFRIVARGGFAQEGAPQDLPFVRRYDAGPALHATLETASATARLADGRLELWIASQAPEQAREAAARAIGLASADVVLYPMPAGGSFDRRLEHDHAIEAALIARSLADKTGRPVQLTWSRWQEQLAAHPRMPAAALLGARLADDDRIEALRIRLACPPAAKEFGRRLFANATPWSAIAAVAGEGDAMAVAGAVPPYATPHLAVDHVPVRLTLPSGRMRGQAHGLTCFMVESFVDELARDRKRDPLAYRLASLSERRRSDMRLAACLQRVGRRARWGGVPGREGRGQGLACHTMPGFEPSGEDSGHVAMIADIVRDEGTIRVTRLFASVDIGQAINRDIALQQIEGGMIFGLGLAMGAGTAYEDGLPSARRLADMGLPVLADCPEIIVDLIESDAPPFDPGEIGVPAIAPAIANAIDAAIGIRLRSLPLLSAAVT